MLRADGQAQARLRSAEAEAQAIRLIADSITAGQGNPAQYLLMLRYIESLTNMASSSNSKVIFMPVETSAVLSSVGGLKEIFAGGGGNEHGETRDLPPSSVPPGRLQR